MLHETGVKSEYCIVHIVISARSTVGEVIVAVKGYNYFCSHCLGDKGGIRGEGGRPPHRRWGGRSSPVVGGSEEIDCAAVPSPTPRVRRIFSLLQTAVPLVVDKLLVP